MKTLIISLILTTIVQAEITANKLSELSKAKHQDVELIEPLQLFTFARNFEMKPKFLFHRDPGSIPDSTTTTKLKMKKVNENLIFISFDLPPLEKPFLVAVTYDRKTGLYNKYMLTPNGQFRTLKGIAIPQSRTVHWHVVSPKEPSINIETYYDKSFTTKEAFLDKEGEIFMVLELNAEASN